MKNLNKLFTLIELIVVIVILSILAAIVIPNVSDNKSDAITSMIKANTRTLQMSTDEYALKNNGLFPTPVQPTLDKPQKIDIDLLYPKYLKKIPDFKKLKEQKYWIDVYGQVWGATEDSPSQIKEDNTTWEFTKQGDVQAINVYQVQDGKVTSKATYKNVNLLKSIPLTIKDNTIQLSKPEGEETSYLLSTIDQYGLESAPAGPDYLGYSNFKPFINQLGDFEFEIDSKDIMYWDSFYTYESKPPGTNITYQFAIKNEEGNYTGWINDFYSLGPSKGIKVKISMTSNGSNRPSLYDLRIRYHFENEEKTIVKGTRIEATLDETGRGRVVDQFILPSNQYIGSVEVTDSYEINHSPKVEYQYSTGDQFVSVPSITDIPAGSTFNIIREGDNFLGFNPPIVKTTTEKPTVIRDSIIPVALSPEDELVKNDPKINETGWKTIQRLNFFTSAGTGEKNHWLKAEINDYKPENTRILYYFSTGNGGSWSTYTPDFSKLQDSYYLKVYALLQVKSSNSDTDPKPKVNSIKIHHSKGISDLSTVKPTGVITPVKSNNKNSIYFSPETKVEWKYEGADPNNRQIVKAEWSGDVREQYPIGKYSVTLKLLNEDNYWSDPIIYSFEVKPERPVAVITMSPDSSITTKTLINWGASGSFDPDGDGVASAQWEGMQSAYETAGNYTVRLRVQDNEGNWSDWTEKTFQVYALEGILEISSGYGSSHSLALTQEGRVKSWGRNYNGELGIGTKDSISRMYPVTVEGLESVIQVAADGATSYALQENGQLMGWGHSDDNQFLTGKYGETANYLTPIPIAGLNDIVKFSAGETSGLAITKDGKVKSWGGGCLGDGVCNFASGYQAKNKVIELPQFTNPKNVKMVYRSAFVITSTNELYAWGHNTNGMLGDGTTTLRTSPVKIMDNVKQVAGVYQTTFILLTNGELYAVGSNTNGTIGDGTTINVTTPKKILSNVAEVSASNTHVLAKMNDSTVKSWGTNSNWHLGDGTNINSYSPKDIPNVTNVEKVTAGHLVSYIVLKDGTGLSFGRNSNYLTSVGTNSGFTTIPTPMIWIPK